MNELVDTRQRAVAIVAATVLLWGVAHLVLPRGAPLGIVLLGAVFGSLYAVVAIGIVLVYRANRVVNFAQAELGSIAGVVAVHLGAQRGWNYFLAVGLGLVLAAVIGAAVERAIIRRFRNASRLILAVVTIAIAQVLNGLSIVIAVVLSRGSSSGSFETPFSVRFGIGPVTFDGDHVLAMIAVPAVLIGLGAFLRRSDYGIAVRAAADGTDRALLLGIPVGRLSTIVWGMAALLSAVGVILRVPLTGIISFTGISGGGTALLVRTLAAAAIARMQSLVWAAVAAVGIGVFEFVAAWNTGNATITDALLVVLILLALLVQRGRLSRTEESELTTTSFRAIREVRPIPTELRHRPEVRFGLAAVHIALLAVAVTFPLWASPSRQLLGAFILVYAIVAVSLVILTGWAGQISLGHWALVGFGGATTAVLHARHGWDFFAALLAGVLVTGLVSLLIGLPALRIRGPFLAVTTLAFALTSSTFLLQGRYLPWFVENRMERPVLWGKLPLDRPWQLYFAALVAFVLVVAGAASLRRTRTGRALVALRDNEPAAETVSIPTTRLKLVAFVISGAIAGLAGGLYVVMQNGLRTDAFAPEVSLRMFSMVVIGGLGSLGGAVLGAVYIRGAEFFLSGGWSLIASGAGVIVLLLFAPGGLGELVYRLRDALLRRLADRRGIVVPSLVADVQTDADVLAASRDDTTPPEPAGDAYLEIRDLDVSYDRVRVLFGVDLSVQEGECVALLGTNGAGKSTLLRAISGLLPADAGRVGFDGRDITHDGPIKVAKAGVVQVPGGRSVFPSLTVAENLRVAGWLYRDEPGYVTSAIEEVLELFPLLRERWDTQAGALSGGEQQMLGLAQAFISRPRLLMIDELSLGLAPVVVGRLLETVRMIHERGTTVILVEQSVHVALRLAERAVFMEKGEVRFDGRTEDLLERGDILRAVFLKGAGAEPSTNGDGGMFAEARARLAATPGTSEEETEGGHDGAVLETRGLSRSYGGIKAVEDVSLELHDGEIVGLIGPNGAGKTTFFDLVTGLMPPDAGSVLLQGVDITEWPAHRRALTGLGRSFQHARGWPSLSVAEAIATARERHVIEPGALHAFFGLPSVRESERRVALETDELIELLGLEAFRDKFVSELSTGSRRIVEIAALLAHAPVVLLLDEPSSGIAQREAEALGPLLRDVRSRVGCSMLVIEHDMRLIAGLADRTVALEAGAVIASGTPDEVTSDPQVVASYLGAEAAEQP